MRRPVELKANRRLLEPQFEGYRLGGRPPVAERAPLGAPPPRPRALGSGRLQARLLALHNALQPTVAAGPSAYFVDEAGGVWLASVEPELHLRRLLASTASSVSQHPPTLRLLPPARALLAIPPARLLLLSTNPSDDDVLPAPDSWQIEAELQPLGPDDCFSLLDARLYSENDNNSALTIHCLLHCIKQEKNQSVNIVEWIVLSLENGSWVSNPHRQIQSSGVIYYCALETDCQAVYIAGDQTPKFVNDSNENPEETNPPEIIERSKKYLWKQTSDDITLTVPLTSPSPGVIPVVETSRDFISVSYDNVEYLRGKLHADIDNELTTWSIENNDSLNILLLKCKKGVVWLNLLKDGDPDGEQQMDRDFVDEVHSRLAHLCSETEVAPENAPLFNTQQLEDCDFVAEEESCLARLDSATRQISHCAFLSSHQVILNVQLNPSEAPALGLRHDADACIWQPYAASNGDWKVEHEGTLLAFGYVQSSKQQKKYTVCSPNLEYSVVCESNRHAFIYRQEWTPQKNSQLRRRTPDGENRRVKVGKQQLISFERDEEVYGICATNEVLFILTENNLMAFEMTE